MFFILVTKLPVVLTFCIKFVAEWPWQVGGYTFSCRAGLFFGASFSAASAVVFVGQGIDACLAAKDAGFGAYTLSVVAVEPAVAGLVACTAMAQAARDVYTCTVAFFLARRAQALSVFASLAGEASVPTRAAVFCAALEVRTNSEAKIGRA